MNKMMFVFLLTLSCFSTFAGENQSGATGLCKDKLEQLKNEGPQQEGEIAPEGSNDFYKCIKITRGQFRNLFRDGNRAMEFDWNKAILASDTCLNEIKKGCDAAKNSAEAEAAFEAGKQKCLADVNQKGFAARCDVAAFLISTEKDMKTAEAKPEKSTSSISGMTCESVGLETLDYEPCMKFSENSSIMDATQQVVQRGQDIYYQGKTAELQADALKNGNSATGSLEALKSGVKTQKEVVEQRAALDTGKIAALTKMYYDMPDRESLKEKCSKYTPPKDIGADQNSCASTIAKPGFAFLKNEKAKDIMKGKLVQAGVSLAGNLAAANLLSKREGDLNKAIANVNEFKPIDPIAPAQTDMQTTYCQQNPGDPKCLTGGLDRTFDMMNDNVVTFGEGGTGASFTANNPFADSTNTNTNAVSPNTKNSITGVGTAITPSSQGGGLANTIAAGTITKGNGPAGGGGGGAAPSGQGSQGGVSAAIGGKAPAYNGGSGFSLLGNGNGLRNKKGEGQKDENPFGKLFGKNGNNNGAVNFRDIASTKVGSKGDNIFDMISKRYTTVSGEKRLIEYENAK